LKVYHLSHTDLDGFSCQYLSSLYFKDVEYYNSNYGKEIVANIDKIISRIQSDNNLEIMIMMTDLNLTVDDCKYFEELISKIDSKYSIKLQLLDHHISGQDCADSFDWYFLDDSRSATKITYDYLVENYKPLRVVENLSTYVDCVNAIDIWLEHEVENFEFGKVCNRAVVDSREVTKNVFFKESTEYKFFMIENCIKYLSKDTPNITLDENIYFLKKEFLRDGKENNTIDNLSSRYVVDLLEKKKDELTVHYNNQKGLMTFGVGGISVLANLFLKQNSDYDFFIDVGFRGNVSLRADGNLNVSKLAQEKFNGGGHVNASGGKIFDFEDIYFYEDAKAIVEGVLIG
jgi:oligoribonuclease NrnB/cAMP/cGMP phosphodiesterase (DHH superfamily)